MWDLLKFVLAVILLPLVVASVVVFTEHLIFLPNAFHLVVFNGAAFFLILFVFFYKFETFYDFGQNLVVKCFQFASPLNKIISCFVPFYCFLIAIVYLVLNQFFHNEVYNRIGFFIFGFVGMMHVVLTAQQLQSGEKPLWKPTYYFTMGISIILLAMVGVLILNLALLKFTFPSFLKTLYLVSKKYYIVVVKKILLMT